MTWKGKSFISVIVFSGDFISMSPAPWCIIQDYIFSLSWCLEHAETTLHGSKLIYADLSFIRAQYLACESGVNNPRQTPGIIARSLQKIWTSDVFSTSSQPLAFFLSFDSVYCVFWFNMSNPAIQNLVISLVAMQREWLSYLFPHSTFVA